MIPKRVTQLHEELKLTDDDRLRAVVRILAVGAIRAYSRNSVKGESINIVGET